MHAEESKQTPALARRLMAAQFPEWADLPIERVDPRERTRVYRLGGDLSVRLPRSQSGEPRTLDKESEWLPIAPHLPLAVPVPLAKGAPARAIRAVGGPALARGRGRARRRSQRPVRRWLSIWRDLSRCTDRCRRRAARRRHNFLRGVPLPTGMRASAARSGLGSRMDTDAVTAAWEEALRAPVWDPPAGAGVRRPHPRESTRRPGPSQRRDRLRLPRGGGSGLRRDGCVVASFSAEAASISRGAVSR